MWPWAGGGSLYCACPGGAAACLNHKRMGRCAGLRPADQGPESTGKRKQGGGRRAGARAEEEVGWGRGKSQPQPWDSLGCSRALFGSPAPREARPRPRGPWLRSLVNGRLNVGERGRGRGGARGVGEGRRPLAGDPGGGRRQAGRACRSRIPPGGGGEGPSGRPPRQPALDLFPLCTRPPGLYTWRALGVVSPPRPSPRCELVASFFCFLYYFQPLEVSGLALQILNYLSGPEGWASSLCWQIQA